MKKSDSRRSFIKKAALGTTIIASAPAILSSKVVQKELLKREKRKFSKNEQIQIAVIGAGGMGKADLRDFLRVPEVECLAVAEGGDQLLRWKRSEAIDVQAASANAFDVP